MRKETHSSKIGSLNRAEEPFRPACVSMEWSNREMLRCIYARDWKAPVIIEIPLTTRFFCMYALSIRNPAYTRSETENQSHTLFSCLICFRESRNMRRNAIKFREDPISSSHEKPKHDQCIELSKNDGGKISSSNRIAQLLERNATNGFWRFGVSPKSGKYASSGLSSPFGTLEGGD